jgi:hypothetical protein
LCDTADRPDAGCGDASGSPTELVRMLRHNERRELQPNRNPQPIPHMELALLTLPALPAAAIGYSLVYMLFGGGIFGAIVIYVIAKMLRH